MKPKVSSFGPLIGQPSKFLHIAFYIFIVIVVVEFLDELRERTFLCKLHHLLSSATNSRRVGIADVEVYPIPQKTTTLVEFKMVLHCLRITGDFRNFSLEINCFKS